MIDLRFYVNKISLYEISQLYKVLHKINQLALMSVFSIDTDTFKWLQTLEIVRDGKRNFQNKIELGQDIANKFYDGLYISRILKVIIQNQSEINHNLLTKMKSIKQNSTPAIRLYNWNLIADVLKHYKYTLDYVQKSKILNLESPPVFKIISYLKGIYRNQNIGAHDDVTTLQKSPSNSSIREKQLNDNPLQVDIKTISNKKLTDAENIMQFFVILLSKSFKLSPQHTLNLFLDNNKYLAHLLVKGIKDSFEPVLSFQNEILNNISFIVLSIFSIDQQKSLEFFFQGLKSCLISKNLNVALKCLQIFKSIQSIYSQEKLDQQYLLNWLRKQGINTLIFSSKRHQQTLGQALLVAFKFMEKQLFEFIRPSEKSPLWSNDTQKLNFYCTFLFVAENDILQSFKTSTCVIQWTKYCSKCLKKVKNIPDMKILIRIFHRKWMQFPQIFQTQIGLADGFISFLKGASFLNDFLLFIHSIKTMFDLMQVLGTRKNSYAPIFYKTLVNCLSFQSSEQRVIFIVDNFISIFRLIDTLPGSLVVEPLLKSIERNCTVSSLNLCKLLITQGKIKQQEGNEIIDVFTKVFFQDINQGSLAIQYIFQCLGYLSEQTQSQFLVKNSQLCLSHFYSLSKSIKRNFQDLKQNFKRYQNQSAMKDGQQAFLAQVKKYLLIENLVKFVVLVLQYQNSQIKKQLEESIFMTYLKVKNELQKQSVAEILKHNLMKRYYDVQQQLIAIIDKYQNQYKAYLISIHKKSISLHLDSEEEGSPIKSSQLIESRLYASKSLIIDDSIYNSKIKPSLFKPEKSALKDLEAIKSKMAKMRIITEQNDKKKDLIQEKKDLVRSVLNEKRILKYGSKSQDLEYKYLFEFDSVKADKNINGMPIVELINLEKQEEDIYVIDADSLMKKYRKVWRFLFFKYSTFGSKTSSEAKVEQKINIAQVWKMHRQYDADFIKKQECFAIIRVINQNMKRKNDLQNLIYLGFEEYIVQFCIFAYNKIGVSYLSPGQKILRLIHQFKSITEEKGGNIDMFSNPEEVYFQQTQVIKEFNRRLVQNSDYILPEGYKKVRQTEYIYYYQFTQPSRDAFKHQNKKFSFNQSYFDVMQVLDMIFMENQKLAFHIVQPKTCKFQKTLAKPALFQQMNERLKNYKGGYMMPKRQINSTYIASRQKTNFFKPQSHPLVQFSLGIKIGLAGIPLSYKYIGQQVAYWMDDMLDSIQNGSPKVGNKAYKKIQNQAIKRKKLMLFKMKNETKQKQKFYKQRSQSVRSEFEKIQVIKQQTGKKRIEQIKSKHLEQKSKQQKQMKNKLLEFQKAKKYFTQKHESEKQKQLKQIEVKKVQKEEYKKNVQEYFKKKKQQLEQKEINLKKNKQYETKKAQEQKEKKKDLQKKVYFSVLKRDEETLQKIQTFKDKYQEFSNKNFIQEQFELHRKSLSMLFQLLLKYEKSKISTTDKHEISQNTFHFFSIKFKIVPFILQKNFLNKIFISIAKQQSNKAGFGLSYRGFEQALLKVIVKSKKMLNQLAEARKNKLNSKLSESIRQEKYQNDEEEKQKMDKSSIQASGIGANKSILNYNLAEDYLFDPQGVTQQTIRQFMLFLNLPDDKIGLQQRYREAIQSKNSKAAIIIRKQLKQQLSNS